MHFGIYEIKLSHFEAQINHGFRRQSKRAGPDLSKNNGKVEGSRMAPIWNTDRTSGREGGMNVTPLPNDFILELWVSRIQSRAGPDSLPAARRRKNAKEENSWRFEEGVGREDASWVFLLKCEALRPQAGASRQGNFLLYCAP